MARRQGVGYPADRALQAGQVREPEHDGGAERTSAGSRTRAPVSDHLRILVPGVAAPKGSLSWVGKGRVVESSKAYPQWKDDVGYHALAAMKKQRYGVLREAVTINITFELPKPMRPRSERHVTKPDLDKLVRGILDALTGVVWIDDSQVTFLAASKQYSMDPQTFIDIAPTT